MSRAMKLVSWILGGLLLFLVMFGIETSHADGGHGHHEGGDTDVDIGGTTVDVGGTEVGGDTLSIGGNKSFAIGLGSFDVDINQCLASKATNIIVVGWQILVENPTCIADGLDARGNHAAAARVRCKHVETVYSSFDTFKECTDAVTMTARITVPPTKPDKVDKDEDEHGHDFEALQQQLAALVEDKAKSDRAAARYVVQQRKEKQADREYAQQLIEEIQQIEEPANEQ